MAATENDSTATATEHPNLHPVDGIVQNQYHVPPNEDRKSVVAKADDLPAEKEVGQATDKCVDLQHQKVALPAGDPKAVYVADEEKLEEKSRTAKWKLKLDYACFVILFGSSELLCIMFLPKNSVNKRIVIAITIIGVLTLTSGFGLLIDTFMLAPCNTCPHPVHQTISKGLTVMSCTSLVITSLPLSFLPKPYNLLTIIVLVSILLTVGAYAYLMRLRTIDENTDLRDRTLDDEQMKKDMMRLSDLSQVIMSLSSGGLFGLFFGIHTNASGHAQQPSVPFSIFLTFTSFILGTCLMFLSQKELIHLSLSTRINFLRFGMGLCMSLLVVLAIAAVAIAYTFLKLFTLMVFIPVLFVYLVWQFMDHYDIQDTLEEEELKLAYAKGNKVTSVSFGGIMAIFGGYLGTSSSDKSMHLNICMVFMASAFLLGLTLMLLSYKPSMRSNTGGFVRILSLFATVPVIFGLVSIAILDFIQH